MKKFLSVLAASGAILRTMAATPASAADEPADNGGGFLAQSEPKDAATVEEPARERAEEVHVRTPANKLCTGTWTHAVSTVTFQRASGGTLATARANLGSPVTVAMPYAYVNGKAITPPYGPHTAISTYDFHGSMNTYQCVGGGSGTIATNNKLTFYWFLKGSKPHSAADRHITCQVPQPGSA
ncbi:hypothetical protein [Streptomyces sp. NK15101]|uniref:hypothetical protein n=1 Tax=Streptomyces sp. NK15101 TaxID=2873261 RepID=UPI001CED49D1|nr:hypothetical protein [Streptomyces sp. NK15101]